MRLALVRYVLFGATFAVGATRGMTQQEGPATSASVGPQAVKVVLKHYAMNPLALDPKTKEALPGNGGWSIGNARSVSCPQTTETCVEVFYQVPTESVRCSWVVLLSDDGTDGKFLDENDDAEHYLLPMISGSETHALVTNRKKPVYPPIAIAAHQSGTVTVNAIVGKSGDVQQIVSTGGPGLLRVAAADAARGWSLKPMTVGSRVVPYEVQLTFTFRTTGPPNGTVEMAP